GGKAAHLLQGRHTLGVELADLLALAVEVDLALEELAVALLEHVGPLIELLVAGEEPALERGDLVAAGAGLLLGLASEPDLLFLRLEDQVLLLGPGVGDDPAGFLLGDLDRLARPAAAGNESHGKTNGETADE